MSEVREGSSRKGLRLIGAGVVVAVVVVVLIVVFSTSGHSRSRTDAATVATTVTQPAVTTASTPVRHPRPATPQTVGLPTSKSASAAASVPIPRGTVAGWRSVFSENFPRSEWAPGKAFASCAWDGLVTASFCKKLPERARGRWFAFPDGSESDLSAGVFEPSSVLSISRSGLNFKLPSASEPVNLAGAIPKLGASAANTLTTGLYVIRFHADAVAGYDFVFNLWPPDNDISRTGYIQFPTGSLADNMQALIYDPGHRQSAGTVVDPQHPLASDWDTGVHFSGWHTAVIERTAAKVEFYLDGRPIGVDIQALPRAPLMLMLQTTPQHEQSPSAAGGQVSVAWLKVYAPSGRAAA